MKTLILVLLSISPLFMYSQTCADQWEMIFNKRGADHVQDDMHRNVIITVIENGTTACYSGKVRVESGKIVSIFIKLKNDEYPPLEGEFYNSKKGKPSIKNGMSEWIIFTDGKKVRIFFIDKIKPKETEKEEAINPEEWLKNN